MMVGVLELSCGSHGVKSIAMSRMLMEMSD